MRESTDWAARSFESVAEKIRSHRSFVAFILLMTANKCARENERLKHQIDIAGRTTGREQEPKACAPSSIGPGRGQRQ